MYILDFSPNPKAMSKPIKLQLEYTFQECKGFCALKQEVTSAVAVNITMVFEVWPRVTYYKQKDSQVNHQPAITTCLTSERTLYHHVLHKEE